VRDSREKQGSRRRRGVRWVANILIVAGMLLLAYPGYTWVSAWYNQYRLQQELRQQNGPVEPPASTIMNRHGAHRSRGLYAELYPELYYNPAMMSRLPMDPAKRPDDFPGALIEIPKIGVSAAVVYGVTLADLSRGPGLYPMGSWPGEPGNLAIAAHRTTWGAWFRRLDELEEGDPIFVESAGLRLRYEVERVFPTHPTDWSVIDQTEENVLTLTTCHPPGSARQRLIVRAAFVSAEKVSGE